MTFKGQRQDILRQDFHREKTILSKGKTRRFKGQDKSFKAKTCI